MKTAATRKNRLFGQADRVLGKTAAAFAAATGVGLVGTAQEAQAQIVYSGAVNIPIPVTTAGTYVNVVTGVNDPVPGNVPGWDLNPWATTNLSWFNPGAPVGGVYVTGGGSSTTLVDNLGLGVLVDAASVYGSGNSEATGATAFNLNSSNNYVGFRFQNEANGNATHYGWVQISLGASLTDPARSIVGYAYEATSGTGILSGNTGVPEPSSLALLSLGGVGLAAYRRRRAAK